jgi:hypothetical protein
MPAYDMTAHNEMKIFMEVIRASAGKYTEVVAKQNAYYNMMEKYVALLRQTRQSLDLVRDSLSAPIDMQGEAQRLWGVAFELRNAMAVFRDASAGTGSP